MPINRTIRTRHQHFSLKKHAVTMHDTTNITPMFVPVNVLVHSPMSLFWKEIKLQWLVRHVIQVHHQLLCRHYPDTTVTFCAWKGTQFRHNPNICAWKGAQFVSNSDVWGWRELLVSRGLLSQLSVHNLKKKNYYKCIYCCTGHFLTIAHSNWL